MRLAALHQDSHTGVGKSNSFKVARRGRESLTSYKVNLLLSHCLSCLPYGKMNTRRTFYNMNLRNLSRTLMRVSQCLPAGGRPMIQPHPFDIISFQEWGYLCTFCFIKEIQYRKFRWLDNVNIIQWLFTRQWAGRGGNREWELTADIHKSFRGISLYICLFLNFDVSLCKGEKKIHANFNECFNLSCRWKLNGSLVC